MLVAMAEKKAGAGLGCETYTSLSGCFLGVFAAGFLSSHFERLL
jgi:hypothetical protein